MIIREAKAVDAPGIARVHVDSWRTTYINLIPDDFLNNLSYEQRAELWKKNIPQKENYVVVAENTGGQIIGFASAGKRESNQVDNSSDLTSLYLLEEYHGQGVGKKLLKEILINSKSNAFDRIFVEVLEGNKTRYFYEYYGAELVKIVQIIIGGKSINEAIYEWNDIDDAIAKL